jgi:ornithine--oxo-acid transaminase
MTSPIPVEPSAVHTGSGATAAHMRRERAFGARNYDPLPVVLGQGAGAWLTDVDGKRYLDLMSAYSAVSFGHAHPKIVAALIAQAQQLAVTSRAFHNDRLPALFERLARITGLDRALPSNGGAEAVETALKAARKWGYHVKNIPVDRAEIVVCRSNFHGRSIAIVGFSSEPQYREGFGPFPPGFATVPFGDVAALAAAITPNTAAFLVEPIQGEGGIIVPPEGYLAECARICRERNVLLICDEIQTGLGRTGYLLACQHDNVRPDGVILGKALGGGLLPVSAFVATQDVMRVFTPGDHGSTFGGNPLAAAVAMAALDVLEEERLCGRSRQLGAWLMAELAAIDSPLIREVRGRGLYIGIEIDPRRLPARRVVDRLLARGVLSKDTHGTVVRIAPPLNVAQEDLAWAVGELRDVLHALERDEKNS